MRQQKKTPKLACAVLNKPGFARYSAPLQRSPLLSRAMPSIKPENRKRLPLSTTFTNCTSHDNH